MLCNSIHSCRLDLLFLSYLPSAVPSLARIELELEIVNSDGYGVLGTNWGRIFLVVAA
jgi:hypothetical protein